MQLSGARIAATAGALVVVGFSLIVVFGDPASAPTASVIALLYAIAAAAILLLPGRWAAWVATAIAVPTVLLTVAVFANGHAEALVDALILLLAVLLQGGAALGLHGEASRKNSSAVE
jgi:hypothetical protein